MAKEKKSKNNEEKKIYSRVYKFSTRSENDEGKIFISEDKIKEALAHKSIKRYAYILHDKDKGTNKHWHCVLEMQSNSVSIDTIAKWFGLPQNIIKVAKGHGAFIDCVEYLTHEHQNQQELGKYLYSDSEVKTNFDFRDEINKRNENILKYGQDLSEDLKMQQDVLVYGKTLKQCKKENSIVYAKCIDKLKKLRIDYLRNLNPPTTRINYYVCGSGGMGKNLMCQALARSLFPQIEDESELYFSIGAEGTTFEGYDGQPIIIWNDCRAIDLLNKLNGRGNVFEVFDTHPCPNPTHQNVKYSSIVLTNVINIVNSVQPYDEFLNGLAGEYKDKSGNIVKGELDQKDQSYRRFPLIIPLHQEDYDILINKGFIDDTREFQQYYEYKHIRGNMQKIKLACKNNEALAKMIESKMVQPIVEHHNLIVDKFYCVEEIDEEELLKQFEDYGIQINVECPIDRFEKVDEPKNIFND